MGDRHLAAALSTAYEAGEGPLTLSVAPRARPAFDRLRSRSQGPLLPPPRQGRRFRRSRTPSADKCSPVPLSRCPFRGGARHRCLGFAASCPAPGACSPLLGSRPERLDRRFSRLFTPGCDGRAPLVDFCNLPTIHEHDLEPPEPRTPRFGSPRSEAPSPRSLSRSKRRTGGSPKRASREFTGQGPSEERERSSIRLLSWRSLAMRALPQPDRLGHLLSRGSLTPAAGAAGAILGQSVG
jgi:hypothetical protein